MTKKEEELNSLQIAQEVNGLSKNLREVEKQNFFILNGSKLAYILITVIALLFWYYLHYRFEVVEYKINNVEKIVDLKIEKTKCNEK